MTKEEKITIENDGVLFLEDGTTNMDAFWAYVNDRYDEYVEEYKNDNRHE